MTAQRKFSFGQQPVHISTQVLFLREWIWKNRSNYRQIGGNLYLRLVYFPFTPMNFGMGLTKVRFWDYFFGTALGIIVGAFIFTFFIGTVKEVWTSGDLRQLLSFKIIFSVALFIYSFFIPKIIKKIKGKGKLVS